MIYLVGGPPRIGKSQLVEKFIANKPMPSFSLDYMYSLSQIMKLEGFKTADILEKGRLFYPTLLELLLEVNRRTEDCVMEGEVIIPEFISALPKKYSIKSCFLGVSNTSLETIIDKAGYFNWPQWMLENGLEREVDGLVERTIRRSSIIEEEAKKYSLTYFDLSNDYDRVKQNALEYLLQEA